MIRIAFLISALLAFCSLANAQQSSDQESHAVYLVVSWHGEGKGFPNTPDAAYSCGFDKSLYTLKKAGMINVYLIKGTDPRFSIVSLRVDNDVYGEYHVDKIEDQKASMYAENLTKQTIYFTVFVRDNVNGQIIECDPQEDNDPQL